MDALIWASIIGISISFIVAFAMIFMPGSDDEEDDDV